ncbi:hypothetical protein DMH26_13490 [Streptomyces sp. WAC 05379]|nr:hypothetical protein DMH26_13490 [Streptomyces sp. WAC 05379]
MRLVVEHVVHPVDLLLVRRREEVAVPLGLRKAVGLLRVESGARQRTSVLEGWTESGRCG